MGDGMFVCGLVEEEYSIEVGEGEGDKKSRSMFKKECSLCLVLC